jgi:hypothetical protein
LGQQGLELGQALFGTIIPGQSGRALELINDRMQRAVAVKRRAVIA